MTYSEQRNRLRRSTEKVSVVEESKAKSKAELVRARVARMNDVSGSWEPADPARRASCENDLVLWLRTYMGAMFFRPFSNDQLSALSRVQDVMRHGGLFAQAMPRGTGKTTMVEGATLWGILNGVIRYCVIFGSEAGAANTIRNDIIKELGTNELLLADYPEVCNCFRAIDGNFHRCKRQTVSGKLTYIDITSNRIVFPEHAASAQMRCAGSIIESYGITSSFRGRKHKRADGTIIRPDFAFLDDPQTRESAGSVKQTADREKVILGDILGLAGHDRAMSAVAAVTVIRRDDLADRILQHDINPQWQGVRTRLVYSWPTNEAMWDKYRKLWEADRLDGKQDTPTAAAYYISNREAMDAGAVVASEHQYAAGELSAIQHAYHLRYQMGDMAYAAEYSNEPVTEDTTIYDLTPNMVQARCNRQQRLHVRPDAIAITAYADINYSALHWTICAFTRDFSCDIIAYGLTPETGNLVEKNASETERKQRIFAGLVRWAELLKSLRLPITRIGIDAGYEPEVVQQFIRSAPGMPVFAGKGFASKSYLPSHKTVLQRYQQCHLAEAPSVGRFVAHNADYWKEAAQRALLPPVGSPGSASIFGDNPAIHRAYAEQICAEVLTDKARGDGGTMFYKWSKAVGACNDWLDSLAGCYVAAATAGLSTAGNQPVVHRKETRKCKVELQK